MTAPQEDGAAVLDLPRTTEEATPAFLTAALRARGEIGADVSVTGVEHARISVGVSISGQLALLTLAYDVPSAGPATLILKLPPTAPENR